MSQLAIVSEDDIIILQFYKKFWYAGWLVALVMSIVAAVAFGCYLGSMKSAKTLALALDRVETTRLGVDRSVEALARAWQEQHEAVSVVIAAADYLQERTKLVDYNRTALTQRPK